MSDASTGKLINIRGLSKWFGPVQVLSDIDLSIAAGMRVVICGPSGSGKSTLIRCLNGLETFQKGNVVVDGTTYSPDEKSLAQVRSSVGMVFQQFNLFPHLTVIENCAIAPRWVRKLSREQANANAMVYLEKVRIAEHAYKYPGQLSGGQQQRVAIARALCMKPKIMLFDEPTSALDPEMVKEVLDTMIALANDGMTMICVTHEMSFARKVAHEVVFMDSGKVVEVGQPDTLFSNPQHARTKKFLSQILQDAPRV